MTLEKGFEHSSNDRERQIEELQKDYIAYLLMSSTDKENSKKWNSRLDDLSISLKKYGVNIEVFEQSILQTLETENISKISEKYNGDSRAISKYLLDKIKIDPSLQEKYKMENLLDDAKKILGQAKEDMENIEDTKAHNEIESFDEDEELPEDDEMLKEELRAMDKEVMGHLLDDKNELFTNVSKDSINALFYKTLIEEIPDIGLSISDDATNIKGEKIDALAVKALPYKTDRRFILDIEDNPILRFLNQPTPSDQMRMGLDLEDQGLLPKGTSDRVFAIYYKKVGEIHQPFWKKKYPYIENITPLSTEEIQNFMKQEIRKEYMKKFNK